MRTLTLPIILAVLLAGACGVEREHHPAAEPGARGGGGCASSCPVVEVGVSDCEPACFALLCDAAVAERFLGCRRAEWGARRRCLADGCACAGRCSAQLEACEVAYLQTYDLEALEACASCDPADGAAECR